MRGKLRDKRTISKRDSLKREVVERRRPKRNTRTNDWLDQRVKEDADYIYDDEYEPGNEEIEINPPSKK